LSFLAKSTPLHSTRLSSPLIPSPHSFLPPTLHSSHYSHYRYRQ
jgi:hypothetical protein